MKRQFAYLLMSIVCFTHFLSIAVIHSIAVDDVRSWLIFLFNPLNTYGFRRSTFGADIIKSLTRMQRRRSQQRNWFRVERLFTFSFASILPWVRVCTLICQREILIWFDFMFWLLFIQQLSSCWCFKFAKHLSTFSLIRIAVCLPPKLFLHFLRVLQSAKLLRCHFVNYLHTLGEDWKSEHKTPFNLCVSRVWDSQKNKNETC